MQYVIISEDGRYWQTARGFISRIEADATLYRDQTEAQSVLALCCPLRSCATVAPANRQWVEAPA